MPKTRAEIIAQGEAGDTEGANREAELMSDAVIEETIAFLESDTAVRDAGLEAFKTETERLVVLSFAMTTRSDLMAMAVTLDPKAIAAVKTFTQTVFLLGYKAGQAVVSTTGNIKDGNFAAPMGSGDELASPSKGY